jgi:hypothetical protein
MRGNTSISSRRPHRFPRLGILHRCVTTPELLRDITRSLGARITAPDSAALFARHDGNLRDAIRELYDRASYQQEV